VALWPGAPYEYTATAGGFVFAAGACSLDEEGREADEVAEEAADDLALLARP
jgi:hypothetical protein